jgi:hypothetical protein
MKMFGKKMFGPRIEVLVIPRQDGDLVFRAQSILDYEPFEKLVPLPTPPTRMLPGGIKSVNLESPAYDTAMDKWSTTKWHWMMVKSLEATEGLEWETVKMDDPETFSNYKNEMKEAGLSPAEIAMIQAVVTDACGLNQVKIEQATKAFLAGQGQGHEDKSSPVSEPSSTPSGEPANASA